jgi:HPr kinase/phosphorylase
MHPKSEILHATTVSIDGRGLLIIGPSGSGKSSLALQLLALGATLVADDRTQVIRDGDQIIASVPPTISGQIEARGVGIIDVVAAEPTPLALVVDLGQHEPKRLPDQHTRDVLGVALPCLHNPDSVYFPSAVLLYMKSALA